MSQFRDLPGFTWFPLFLVCKDFSLWCDCAGCGKEEVCPGLRHSYVTAALDAGMPLRNVQVYSTSTAWVPASDVRRPGEGEWHGRYVPS